MEIIDRTIEGDKLIRRSRTLSGMIDSEIVITKGEFLMAYHEWIDDAINEEIERPDQGYVYRRVRDNKSVVILSRFISPDQDICYMDEDGIMYDLKYTNFIRNFYRAGYLNHIACMTRRLAESKEETLKK